MDARFQLSTASFADQLADGAQFVRHWQFRLRAPTLGASYANSRIVGQHGVRWVSGARGSRSPHARNCWCGVGFHVRKNCRYTYSEGKFLVPYSQQVLEDLLTSCAALLALAISVPSQVSLVQQLVLSGMSPDAVDATWTQTAVLSPGVPFGATGQGREGSASSLIAPC